VIFSMVRPTVRHWCHEDMETHFVDVQHRKRGLCACSHRPIIPATSALVWQVCLSSASFLFQIECSSWRACISLTTHLSVPMCVTVRVFGLTLSVLSHYLYAYIISGPVLTPSVVLGQNDTGDFMTRLLHKYAHVYININLRILKDLQCIFVTIAQWRRARNLINLIYPRVPGSIPAENPTTQTNKDLRQ